MESNNKNWSVIPLRIKINNTQEIYGIIIGCVIGFFIALVSGYILKNYAVGFALGLSAGGLGYLVTKPWEGFNLSLYDLVKIFIDRKREIKKYRITR